MKQIYFFIGTEAELIKLFTIMDNLQQKGIPYKIIASGQNDISKSSVLKAVNGGRIDWQLSDEKDIKKTAAGLLEWYFKTYQKGVKLFKQLFGKDKNAVIVVHGDTVSTMMGAYLGGRFGLKVAHVEAGLRSHNWFKPFPEEIDRVLTSRKAKLHFAPGKTACENLKNVKGNVVNTVYNTIADSLEYSRKFECKNDIISSVVGREYFVMVIHRQENLMDKTLLSRLVETMQNKAKETHCVFVLHTITEIALNNLGLMDDLRSNPNITLLPRAEYFDFMKLLENALFVITDGGSNQEELSYMGKPCLIIRTHTERQDGIGENAILYGGNLDLIDTFVENYKDYKRDAVKPEFSPTEVIVENLLK
ncbi:MAG: UDP-N-acetylglucosamine 2-epimerase [Oscillospiraceae bacterium]|nr:UDP-N-acetylglucosamine 2-epimerase [Oscillospiraceae bacterium]